MISSFSRWGGALAGLALAGMGVAAGSGAEVKTETATFAGGCFWCLEAIFQQLNGVVSVTSGFMGGRTPDPSYEAVCRGDTGHAEVVQVVYDPSKITYDQLLDWFWQAHDPTQLNRQGPDTGEQYRSVIFCHNEEQKRAAAESKRKLQASGKIKAPVVTAIEEASTFYPAEAYHQDYYRLNRDAPYCRFIIAPKMEKMNLAD